MEKHKDKKKDKNKDKNKYKNKAEKKKKSGKKSDRARIPATIVTDDISLVNAIATNTPYELGTTYKTLSLPIQTHVSAVPLFEALSNSTTVTELVIVARIWGQEELTELVKCLSSNKSIRKIVLRASDFSTNFVEALTKILKTNLQIKTLEIANLSALPFNVEGFNRFCGSVEYYHFEDLVFSSTELNAKYKTIFDSLKYNRTIKTIKVIGDSINGDPFQALCTSLVSNPTITHLSFDGISMNLASYELFKDVLKANYIKKLEFSSTQLATNYLTAIKEELKNNKSLTDLSVLFSYGDWKLFGEIIQDNKAITRLNISFNGISDNEFKQLNLGSNTTLKELVIDNCNQLKQYSVPLSELLQNTTLKRLHIGTFDGGLDHVLLERLLTISKSIVEIEITRNLHSTNDQTLRALADGLKVNRTIRKLTVQMPVADEKTLIYFIKNVLKYNPTVTELSTTKIANIHIRNLSNVSSVEDLFLDLLRTNKTLRYITGSEDYPLIDEQLKSNRDAQDKIISDTCTLIKMIVMKPHSFILPIEIWLKIFSYVSYDCTPFNFEQFFRKFIT